MANREPNANDPANQPDNPDPIDVEINRLFHTLEATEVLNPPKKRSRNDWKRVAEEGFLEGIERSAAAGDTLSESMLQVHDALYDLRRAMEWPEATLGQIAQFVYYCFEDCWQKGVRKRLDRGR